MVDHELLTLAARAAGITLTWPDGENDHPRVTDKDGAVWIWNPVEFPGDCLQLEVSLDLNVMPNRDCVDVYPARRVYVVERYNSHDGDKLKARMMASTRAAAEIGKTMKE
jgi:hypothetical protein